MRPLILALLLLLPASLGRADELDTRIASAIDKAFAAREVGTAEAIAKAIDAGFARRDAAEKERTNSAAVVAAHAVENAAAAADEAQRLAMLEILRQMKTQIDQLAIDHKANGVLLREMQSEAREHAREHARERASERARRITEIEHELCVALARRSYLCRPQPIVCRQPIYWAH